MKNARVKEQLIAIFTLGSIFIFFIYLKMNPEVSSNNFSQNSLIESQEEIISIKIEDNKKSLIDKLTENENEESENSEYIPTINFTEKELERVKSYMDRDWRPDVTINMIAWEYVLNANLSRDDKVIQEGIQVCLFPRGRGHDRLSLQVQPKQDSLWSAIKQWHKGWSQNVWHRQRPSRIVESLKMVRKKN